MQQHKQQFFIVDDNEAICLAMQFLLRSVYDIHLNIYPEPALFLQEVSPDWMGVVFVDLCMPLMDGVTFMRQLKQYNKSLRIIIISGYGNADIEAQALREGACAFFSKPFHMDRLLEKVGDMLQ